MAEEADIEREDEEAPQKKRKVQTQIALFVMTVASTFTVGASMVDGRSPLRGWVFAVPLLAILVTHELGHYLFAIRHRVPASVPYFIPFPFGPLGTLGAVIAMRGRIKTRDALLDIGASGPIAGLLVAIPVLAYGLKLSTVEPIPPHGLDEGQSLFYLLMKRIVLGPIPPGYDVFLHPTAFAGWAGLFMTMLNLMPIGQLDGGHVAYAVLGPKQDRYSKVLRFSLPVVFLIVGVKAVVTRALAHAPAKDVALGMLEGANWLVWFVLLTALMWGPRARHPPTDNDTLSTGRKVVAWAMLAMFVLLFMPVVLSSH
jgi:membrane-associated protease RseP (regulator of RpoE activity)